MLIIAIVNKNMFIFLTPRAVMPACFLIYINWAVVEGLSPGQIPQTLVTFQAKDLVLMAVVTGLTPTS